MGRRPTQLHLANGLSLPLEAVTQTFGILAKRGVGKTYTAKKMAEQMLKAGIRIVIIDPIGVWWGLRVSANSKEEGLPIPIFGGDHADVPLEATAGEMIANLIVTEQISAVLDLSRFRKADQDRFVTALAERLYHQNRKPLHIFVDEADSFAPQRPQHGQERMLGAMEDLVRRGRARGIGLTLVTQRSAVLNKNVLSQVEVLVALRTIAPQDRLAIDAWIDIHGDKEKRQQMMDSMSSLEIGQAWFWSPGWLELFKKVKINECETYDSSATPKFGAKVTKSPKLLARVDIERIKVQMASTIEKSKQDDPRELRRQIAELQVKVAKGRPEIEVREKIKTVIQEIPAFSKRDRQLLRKLIEHSWRSSNEAAAAKDRLADVVEKFAQRFPHERDVQAIRQAAETVTIPVPTRPSLAAIVSKALDANDIRHGRVPPQAKTKPYTKTASEIMGGTMAMRPGIFNTAGVAAPVPKWARTKPLPELKDSPEAVPTVGVETKLLAGERRMIEVLIQMRDLTRDELGTLAILSPGGTFNNYYGELKNKGYIVERGGKISLEKIPKDMAKSDAPVITRTGVCDAWKAKLLSGERRMLDAILSKSMTREELGVAAQLAYPSGTYNNYFGSLRKNGLIILSGDLVELSGILSMLPK